jgi:hypothetical protein
VIAIRLGKRESLTADRALAILSSQHFGFLGVIEIPLLIESDT